MVEKAQFRVIIRMVKKRQFRMFIKEVTKGQFRMVITVLKKRSSLGWLLRWLKKGAV